MFEFLAQLQLHDVAGYVVLLFAAAFASVSRSPQGERHHVWLAVGAAMVGVSWIMQRRLPLPSARFEMGELPWHLLYLTGLCITWSGVVDHLRLPLRAQRRLTATGGVWLAAGLAVVVASSLGGLQVSRSVAYLPMVSVGVLLALVCFRSARIEPGLGQWLMGLAVLSMPVVVLAGVVMGTQAAYLRFLSFATYLLVCMTTLQGGYVREQRRLVKVQRELQRASDELEHRVSERTAELAAARDQAQAGERAKGRFLAQMSHEIRTPITGVLGTLELLRAADDAGERRTLLASAEAAALELRSLLDRVVDLSKLEAGSLPLERKLLDLHTLCQSVLDDQRTKAQARGVSLHLHLAGGAQHMRGDALRLGQVLEHLLSNAVAYGGPGEVLVTARTAPTEAPGEQPGLMLCLAVADGGPGVPAQRAESIFEPFEQADGAEILDRPHGGIGLGLTLSRSLARAMGGDLTYQPRDGGGSLFQACIPVEPVNAEELTAATAADPQTAPPGGALVGRAVLVADDNAIVQTLLRRILQREGARVVAAWDGEQALAKLALERFDAVLMDVSMLRLNGIEATRAIRASTAHPGLPVVGISAHAMAGDREACLAAGMDVYLTKPLSRDELVDALTTVLPD